MKTLRKISLFVFSMISLCAMAVGTVLPSFACLSGDRALVISRANCEDEGHIYDAEDGCGCKKKKKKNHSLERSIG